MVKKSNPLTIILTGGTGCGKSTVAAWLKKMGARVVDVDRLAHALLKPGGPVWQQVLWNFCGARWQPKNAKRSQYQAQDFNDGEGRILPERPWAIRTDGTIRRDRLGATVFSSPDALAALNKIMHPELRKMLDETIRLHNQRSRQPLVLDMAVYPAASFRKLGDVVVWVRSPRNLRVQRLLKNRQVSARDARARVSLQWTDEEYKKVSDMILANTGSLARLEQQVRKLWQRLASAKAGGS